MRGIAHTPFFSQGDIYLRLFFPSAVNSHFFNKSVSGPNKLPLLLIGGLPRPVVRRGRRRGAQGAAGEAAEGRRAAGGGALLLPEGIARRRPGTRTSASEAGAARCVP